ncbi:IS701 family transposase [Streptomyces sp. NPDC088387]|uniref:IS701 family transposase n=1 Tax=Streptomyces sp. NPDC088387 TaxID=3365859 RepID=UPI003806F14E
MHAAKDNVCVLDAPAPVSPGLASPSLASPDLASPAQRLFAHLPRADQRRWAGVYLKGLLSAEGKKTLRRMAASVTSSPTAAQSLQQFVNDSAWRWRPVRAELARWAGEITAPHAWTLAPVVIPKRGELSVGVHRRFEPVSGRTVNCQLAIGAFLSGDRGDLSVDWELYLPRRWTEDERLRHQARVPDGTRHTSAAALCLALADRLARITPRMPPVVVHTEGHLDAGTVIEGLTARGLDWIVAVPDTFPLSPDTTTLPRSTETEPARRLLRRHPTPGRTRFTLTRVTLPSPAGPRPALLAGPGTPAHDRPTRTWLTSLPPARQGQALALIGSAEDSRIGVAEAESGLYDFAGRSYPGWHRHATLVSVAAAHRALGHEVCPPLGADVPTTTPGTG